MNNNFIRRMRSTFSLSLAAALVALAPGLSSYQAFAASFQRSAPIRINQARIAPMRAALPRSLVSNPSSRGLSLNTAPQARQPVRAAQSLSALAKDMQAPLAQASDSKNADPRSSGRAIQDMLEGGASISSTEGAAVPAASAAAPRSGLAKSAGVVSSKPSVAPSAPAVAKAPAPTILDKAMTILRGATARAAVAALAAVMATASPVLAAAPVDLNLPGYNSQEKDSYPDPALFLPAGEEYTGSRERSVVSQKKINPIYSFIRPFKLMAYGPVLDAPLKFWFAVSTNLWSQKETAANRHPLGIEAGFTMEPVLRHETILGHPGVRYVMKPAFLVGVKRQLSGDLDMSVGPKFVDNQVGGYLGISFRFDSLYQAQKKIADDTYDWGAYNRKR